MTGETADASKQLRSLFDADQKDRRDGIAAGIMKRDEKRRRQVEQLIAAGQLRTAEDFFHAAMIFQHGGRTDDFRRAHDLALKAVELGSTRARWLAAAAFDRWLMSEGKPQKFGTQYRAEDGRWVLHDVDTSTTDEDRAKWNVPSLEIARARAEQMTQERPPAR